MYLALEGFWYLEFGLGIYLAGVTLNLQMAE